VSARVRIAAPALLVLVALLAAVLALQFGGGSAPLALIDPGALVRWGLPIAKLLVNLSAAGTLGALVLAAFALRSDRPEYGTALDVAAGSAAVWTVSSAATGLLSYLDLAGSRLSLDTQFGAGLASFLTTFELGQAWLATTLIAAVLTVLSFAARNQTIVLLLAVGTVLGFIPMALQGHAGGAADHAQATSAIFLHVVGAAAWLGGLLVLALLGARLDRTRLAAILPRYSSIALVCFVVVAVSGYVSAEIRVGSLDRMLTPYGALVTVKVVALLALGAFGVVQRRFFMGRLAASESLRAFWALIVAEVAFMGIAAGTAAALARTATPVAQTLVRDETDPTPAELLTESPLPPPVSIETLLSRWEFDLVWVLACGFAIFFYVAGVRRLHRRGDRWPVHRTVLWFLGILVLFYTTNGGLATYERYLFSAHMTAHMVLTMLIPVLLAPAAPVTLALRAIAKRDDGSRGAREWILLLVHSRFFRVLSNPVVAAVLFAASLWVFYYSPLFRWATVDHVGHEWMVIHFVLTGYLFVNALIGVDPASNRAPYPMRLIILLATMAFHAFFGLSLLSGSTLLLADWYGAMGWGTPAIDDQQTGGGIAWGIGEIPTVALAIVVAVMWARSDERDSKRLDRKADRDGDAELEAYNAMLAGRARTPDRA
jgi:putative copper resistance protein D